MVCKGYGGRVELAKAYYKALNESTRKHLKGNNVIASMEHCNDFMYLGTEAIALGRVGDDFWCTDGGGDPYWLQGCHVVHCAYNSLWMGNMIQPDWDMFQSTHPCAEFHAAARAISGGPIYVSDGVGRHDYNVLKRVALRDGTILRAEGHGVPTRDCLFEDPGKTMLKIWNVNRYTGVVGVFNCMGGGWSREERRNRRAKEWKGSGRSTVRTGDVEWKEGEAEEYGVYTWREGAHRVVRRGEGVEVALEPLGYELVTVAPVQAVGEVKVAVVGLANMFNGGAAVRELELESKETLKIRLKGEGEMLLYCSRKPSSCLLDGSQVTFHYQNSLVKLHVPWNHETRGFTFLKYIF